MRKTHNSVPPSAATEFGRERRTKRSRKWKSPGCGTRGSSWSGGAPAGRARRLALRPSRPSGMSPLALPLHFDLASSRDARWAHCTSLVPSCQVARSSDFRNWLVDSKTLSLCPFWGTVPIGGLHSGEVFGMLRLTMTPRAARASTTSACRRARPRLGERAAAAARRRRADADRPRRRPLLEGVHLPDRARQDAPDDRDGRVARAAARCRRRLPRERRLRRRAREGRGDPRPRRRAARGAPASTRRSPSTRGRCRPSSAPAPPSSASAR